MSLYCSFEQVRIRVIGKVRFTENEADENKMQTALANKLINESEGEVEHDLSPRYVAPFQTIDGTAFGNLPSRPTKELLRTLCELKASIRILETDFGAGGTVDAEKYIKNLEARYQSIIKKLLSKKAEGSREWAYPPLPSLRLNWHNTEADDGYSGMVLHSSNQRGDYPSTQINSPSETFWNGTLDELDSEQ